MFVLVYVPVFVSVLCLCCTTVVLVFQGLNHSFYECDHHLWRLGGRKLPRGIAIGETAAAYRDREQVNFDPVGYKMT